MIYNEITKTKEYPRAWVVEQQIPIPKANPPSSIEDIRNISGTPFFSKQYESFISDWLLPIVDPFLDPGQCGGLKRSSISHYLVKLLHYIHYNLDRPKPHAVLLACVDMSKAFNRVSHQHVIEDLFHMKVPGWLLLIIISYLTNRKMMMKFRGILSALRSLPGSSPQGTVLGVILFIIYFNSAALRPEIPRQRWPFFSKNNYPTAIKMKFVDDLSIACKVNLNNDLVVDEEIPKPLTYDARFGTVIDKSKNTLQQITDSISEFCIKRQMKVNTCKSSVMKISKSRTKSFSPDILINGDYLKQKSEMKILCIIVQNNLKWNSNTAKLCKKAYKNLWVIRRMKNLG